MDTQNIWIAYSANDDMRAKDGVSIRLAATTREAAIRQLVAQLRAEADEEIGDANAQLDESMREPLVDDEYWQGLTTQLQLGEHSQCAYHDFDDSWVWVEQTSLFGGAA